MFVQKSFCGAQETFINEVEIIRSELESAELVIEGQFVSVATMEEWGRTEYFARTLGVLGFHGS